MGAGEIDSLEIKVQATAQKANQSLDALIGKLDRLTTSLGRVNGNSLVGLSNGVHRLGTSMQTMNNIKTADFTRLASNLSKLGAVNTTALNGAASSMSHLTRAFNSLGAVSQNAMAVGELAKNIAKLGNKSVQTAITNIPRLATSLNGLMTTLSKSPQVSQNVIQMTNALAKLSVQGSKIGTAGASISSGLGNATNSAIKANKSFGGLAYTFGKFYASCFLVIRGLKKLWESTESSMDYVETFNYWNVTLDKIGTEFGNKFADYGYDSAESYVSSFQDRLNALTRKMTGYEIGQSGDLMLTSGMNLGLDPEQLMNFQARISAVTNAVGLCGETSVNTAKALSMLSADMSSFTNQDLSTVMTNLQSGIIGQSRALYKYGIDITNATLQTYAYEYGITKAVSEMTQSEKMQLRLIAILDQSKVAWGDQANTINSVANQYRILKQQTSNLARTLGNLFLPIVKTVLPVVNGLVIALNRLFTALGFQIYGNNWLKDLQDGISGGYAGDGLEDLADSADDVTDSLTDAASAAKKLKTATLGIDELNINSPQEDSGSGSGSSVGGGIDLSSAIADALADYEALWNAALAESENKAQSVADAIEAFFAPIKEYGSAAADSFIDRFDKGNINKIENNLNGIKDSIVNLFSDSKVQEALEKYGKQSAETAGAVVAAGANLFTSYAAGATSGIDSALKDLEQFNKTKLTSIVNNMTALSEKTEKVSDAFSQLSQIFQSESFEKIAKVLTKIADVTILEYIDRLTGVLSDLFGIATGPFTENIDKIKSALQKFLDIVAVVLSPAERLLDLFAGDSKSYEDSFFHKLLSGIETLLSMGLGTFLDNINAKLEIIYTVVSTIGSAFSFAVDVVSMAKEAIENFADLIGMKIGSTVDGIKEKINTIKEWIEKKVLLKLENAFNLSNANIGQSFSKMFSTVASIGAATINGLINAIESGINWIINGINDFINSANSLISKMADVTGKSWGGIGTISTISLPRIEVNGYLNGGFPEDGWFRASQGELIGKFDNGQTVVANNNQIIDGISNGVRSANSEQNALLREQNELLRELLAKDTSINIGDREIYKASVRGKKSYGSLIVT